MRPLFWQRRAFHGGVALALLGLVFWFYKIRTRQFRRQQVQHEFSRRLIQAQEQERKRISAELHDSLGQNLTVVKNRLTLQQMEAGEENGSLKEVADLVALTIEDTRRISRNLRPFALDRIGLAEDHSVHREGLRMVASQTAP